MANTVYDRYMEAEILCAHPVKLVGILYRAAVEAVAGARRHLHHGEIRERSQSIVKASEILNELMRSLDHSAGGDISRNLVELYAYMQTRLIEANAAQTEPPLAEVEQLLITLSEAWHAASPALPPPAPEAEYVPISCTA